MKEMKKIRNLLIAAILMFCLAACGKKQEASEVENVSEGEPAVEAVETTDTQAEEPTDTEAAKTEEEKVIEEKEAATETAEQTEPEEAQEESKEVEYITDFTSVSDYIATLDPEQPAIIIYNQTDNYIVNMEQDQHYQLKANDEILLNATDLIEHGCSNLGSEFIVYSNYLKAGAIDYSSLKKDPTVRFIQYIENEDPIMLTCYLNPPVE